MKIISPKDFWIVLKHSFHDFSTHKITKRSASLAFYTIFSLPGMLMVIITILDTLYGREAMEGVLQNKISATVGEQAAHQIQGFISNAAISGQTTVATIIGVMVLIYGATKMFGEMQESINMIWNLQPKPKKGWVKFLINRLVSFSLVVTLGFLLLVSFVITGIIAVLSDHLASFFPEVTVVLVNLINLIVSLIITAFLFAIIFKFLPDAKIRWRDVSVGAIFTTILFTIGKFLIGIYMSKSDVGSTYGAAGSVIVILLWIYYSAIILYFGVAFTKEYAQLFGKHIYPLNAVWTKEVELDDDSKPLQEIEEASKEEKINPK